MVNERRADSIPVCLTRNPWRVSWRTGRSALPRGRVLPCQLYYQINLW